MGIAHSIYFFWYHQGSVVSCYLMKVEHFRLESESADQRFQKKLFQTNRFIPVVGAFGPRSNFSIAASNSPAVLSTIQVVGAQQQNFPAAAAQTVPVVGSQPGFGQNPVRTSVPIVGSQGSQSVLPQAVDANRYSNPEGILDGIVDQKAPVFSNGSALQVNPSLANVGDLKDGRFKLLVNL